MASWTPLTTYDPDWKARWERCHAVITASRAEQRTQDWKVNAELDARCSRELDALHAAYHARFQTVEEFRDHFMALDLGFAHGLDVPLPQFPEGASLEEVEALLARFRDDREYARREKYRPLAADPPDLTAFTTPARAGCERVIGQFSLPESLEGGAGECLLIMEATPRNVHVCFVSCLNGGSICINIERLATRLYRNRFAPRGLWQQLRASAGLSASGTYMPKAMIFYDYQPWNLGGSSFYDEDFSAVEMAWNSQLGFVKPAWKRFRNTPVFIAEAALCRSRQLRADRRRLHPGHAERSDAMEHVSA